MTTHILGQQINGMLVIGELKDTKVNLNSDDLHLIKPFVIVPTQGGQLSLAPYGYPVLALSEVTVKQETLIWVTKLNPLEPEHKQHIDNYVKARTGLATGNSSILNANGH